MVTGFTFLSRLTQIAQPHTRFVFPGAGFRLGLPSHPASRRRSCLRLGVSTTSSSRGPSPPMDRPCRAYSRAALRAVASRGLIVVARTWLPGLRLPRSAFLHPVCWLDSSQHQQATRPHRIATGANHPAQHVPTFVPRRAETAKSQPFETPNSVLSHMTRQTGMKTAAWEWLRKHDGLGYCDVNATNFPAMRCRRVPAGPASSQGFAAPGSWGGRA